MRGALSQDLAAQIVSKCSELGRCHAINPLFLWKLIFLYPSWLTRAREGGKMGTI